MSEDAEGRSKPDGSAWKAHMEALSERNSKATRAGRKEREDHERERAAAHRASELRQMVALNRTTGSRAKTHRP